MDIVQKAEQFVFDLFKDKLSPEYTYHNFNHTSRVAAAVEKLVDGEQIAQEQRIPLFLAAWFHDTGFVGGCDNHEQNSIAIFNEFAIANNIDRSIAGVTEELIRVTDLQKQPENILEYIIRDADCAHFGNKNFFAISELLREEWRVTLGKSYSNLEWATGNKEMLTLKHKFYTGFAKRKWQPRKEINIALLQERIREFSVAEKESAEKAESKKAKAEKENRPEKGIETMFRVTLHNHTVLSQIADSKANILLSVNAIILSIALSTLIPKLDSPGNAHLIIPTFLMVLFSVVTIIFAILSTRPKVSGGTFTREDINNRKINLLFFGNFHKMPLDEYHWAMNEMMQDRDYLYSSMIKDLYFLGLVLGRKYKLLRITYNIFMIGIIISAVTFILAFRRYSPIP